MAEVDDWKPVTPQRQQQDDWVPVTAGQPVAITSGEKEFAADRAKIDAAKNFVPEELKTGLYSAANAAAFNIPSHVMAFGTKYLGGDERSYTDVYNEQKAFEEALSRQNPKASMAGTAVGVVGGALVPLGVIGQGARGLKAVGSGALTAGGLSGASSAIEKAPEVLEGDKKAWTGVMLDTALGGVLGGAMAPIAGKIADKFAKMPEIVTSVTDDAGNVVQKFTPEAETAIKSVFGDRLSAEELASFQDDIVKSVQQKGFSAPAVREALLAKEGIEPSASLATGLRAQRGGLDAATEARQAAAEKLQSKVADMYDPTVSKFAGAEALQGAERKVFGDLQSRYEGSDVTPGAFGSVTETGQWSPTIPRPGPKAEETYSIADFVTNEITSALRKEGKVTNPELLSSYPQSADALRLVENTIKSGELPYEGPATLKNMFKIHQQMNALQGLAKGDDFATLGVIKQGYVNALDRAVEEGLFRGGDGAKAIANLMDINKDFSKYMKDWYNKRGGEASTFKRIMGAMVDPDTGYIASDLTPGMAQAAQGLIDSGLMNPGKGPLLYERIQRALADHPDAMNAFNAQIRNNIVKMPADGLKGLPAQINEHLSPALRPITEKAFGAVAGDEKSIKEAREKLLGLRRLSEAARIINENPKASPAEKEGMFKRVFNYIVYPLVGAAAGSMHGPLATVAGSLLAQGAAEIPRALTARGQLKAEQFGAPLIRPQGVIDPRAYQLFRNVPAMDPADEEGGYGEPRPLAPLPRQGRKSGGRVGVMTAEGLMAALEKAKREVSGETKVLLNSSDETVARALEIANQHIEG